MLKTALDDRSVQLNLTLQRNYDLELHSITHTSLCMLLPSDFIIMEHDC